MRWRLSLVDTKAHVIEREDQGVGVALCPERIPVDRLRQPDQDGMVTCADCLIQLGQRYSTSG